jgi:hypothetical protein
VAEDGIGMFLDIGFDLLPTAMDSKIRIRAWSVIGPAWDDDNHAITQNTEHPPSDSNNDAMA